MKTLRTVLSICVGVLMSTHQATANTQVADNAQIKISFPACPFALINSVNSGSPYSTPYGWSYAGFLASYVAVKDSQLVKVGSRYKNEALDYHNGNTYLLTPDGQRINFRFPTETEIKHSIYEDASHQRVIILAEREIKENSISSALVIFDRIPSEKTDNSVSYLYQLPVNVGNLKNTADLPSTIPIKYIYITGITPKNINWLKTPAQVGGFSYNIEKLIHSPGLTRYFYDNSGALDAIQYPDNSIDYIRRTAQMDIYTRPAGRSEMFVYYSPSHNLVCSASVNSAIGTYSIIVTNEAKNPLIGDDPPALFISDPETMLGGMRFLNDEVIVATDPMQATRLMFKKNHDTSFEDLYTYRLERAETYASGSNTATSSRLFSDKTTLYNSYLIIE